MRRWFALLLLVLLPLQFSWAVVEDYCVHGPEGALSHPAHHDHAVHGHGAADVGVGDPAQPDGASLTAAPSDCGHCHGHCAALVETSAVPGSPPPGSARPASGDAARAGAMPAPPERPQWAGLA